MSDEIVATLAVDMFDQATAGRERTIALDDLLTHHERPEKTEPGAGRWGGVTFARFRDGPCGCAAAPTNERRGCPDFATAGDGSPHHGHRLNENALAVTALGLDLDKNRDGSPLDATGAAAALERIRSLGVRAIAYSTHSFAPPERCALRVVFALSREISPADWPRFRDAAYGALELPPGCRPGARHFWWLPSCAPGAPRWSESFPGAPLDVDAVLAAASPPSARPETDQRISAGGALPSEQGRAEAARVLAAVWPASGRHSACLALLGGLARDGWPAEAAAEFTACVMAVGPGSERLPWHDEYAKQLSQAERTIEKLSGGAEVAAWGALADLLADPLAADQVRGMLRAPAPELLELRETLNALARPPPGSFAACCARAYEDVVAALAASVAGDTEPRPLFEPIADVLGRSYASTPWLVRGLVKRGGVLVVGGEPKTGKSWVLTDVMVAVATGGAVFGEFEAGVPDEHGVRGAGRVFYLYAEDGGADVRSHVLALCAGRDVDARALTGQAFVQPAGRFVDVTKPEHLALIIASVRWAGGADMVCLEPLRDIHSGEEDSSDSMRDVMRALRVLGVLLSEADRPCTVATAHHTKKVEAGKKPGRGGNALRGSSAIFGALDGLISLGNPTGNGEDELVSEVECIVRGARSAGFFDLSLKIDDDAKGSAVKAVWTYSKLSRDEKAKRKSEREDAELEERVISCVRAFNVANQPCNVSVVREAMGSKTGNVGEAIKRLQALPDGDPRRLTVQQVRTLDSLQRPRTTDSLVATPAFEGDSTG